jgi:hypothetical protein
VWACRGEGRAAVVAVEIAKYSFTNAKYDLQWFEILEYLTLMTAWMPMTSLLHSWQSHVSTASYGASIGFSPVTNMWLGVGYNLAGFRDRDFTSANATAKGWYLYMRMKADQGTKDSTTQRQVMFDEVTR